MKNYKIKKTVLALSFISIASIGTLSAQWAVTNVNDPIYFSPTGIFTQSVGRIMSGVKGSIDSVRETANIQIAQQDGLQEDTDKRNRIANGVAEIYKKDLEQIPTIQQCVELTNKQTNTSAVSATHGAGGGGGRGAGGAPKPDSREKRQEEVKDTATAQASLLLNKTTLKTCAGGMDNAIQGCSGVGEYAGGDINSSSITQNISGKQTGKDLANFSLNSEGYKVAQKYANDSTLYDAPRFLNEAQAKKNPSYIAMYNSVINKLNASNEAILSIAKIRRAPDTLIGGAAGANWTKSKGEYEQTLGLKQPSVPSLFELLNFTVFNDYAGPNSAKPKSGEELQQEVSRKITLANVISLKQLQATEQNNILLAHLLVQQVTPVNIQSVHAEHAKTVNMK